MFGIKSGVLGGQICKVPESGEWWSVFASDPGAIERGPTGRAPPEQHVRQVIVGAALCRFFDSFTEFTVYFSL